MMINSDHREIIETFRIAFICGCVSREDIVMWADEILLKEGNYDFIELSMSGNLPYQDFESLLLKIGKRFNHFQCLRRVLGRMAVQIEQGHELHREFAKGLYHFVAENAYEMPDDMTFLSGIDDEYALAENGTYGSVDEINDRLFNELKEFKSKQSASPDWYSAALHTSR